MLRSSPSFGCSRPVEGAAGGAAAVELNAETAGAAAVEPDANAEPAGATEPASAGAADVEASIFYPMDAGDAVSLYQAQATLAMGRDDV
jgi:hypothetical protein